MKKIKIKKNKHYPFPYIPTPILKKIYSNKCSSMQHGYIFTESCLYKLDGNDQNDVNKLFGFSIGHHHKTSFRFGWRCNLKTRKIEIVGYEYHDGIRQPTISICEVNLNCLIFFRLYYYPYKNKSEYIVFEENPIVKTNNVFIKKKFGWGYTLGLYFGGNQKAPHEIIIYKK